MKKIRSPWKNIPEFRCFGCSPYNANGLQMKFEVSDNGEIVCHWHPREYFQGWHDVLHGGIQCTLLDEVCAWVVFHDLQSSGVTIKLDTKFIKTLYTTDSELLVTGKLTKTAHGMAWIEASIKDSKGEVGATASAVYKVFDKEQSSKDFGGNSVGYEND